MTQKLISNKAGVGRRISYSIDASTMVSTRGYFLETSLKEIALFEGKTRSNVATVSQLQHYRECHPALVY